MNSLNRAEIIGRLTAEPEMKQITNGLVANFSVATNRSWTSNDGQKQEQVEYHNVVAFGKLAEICQKILHKGNLVFIEGRLQTSNWEGQDGVKRYKTEIVANEVKNLTPKSQNEKSDDSWKEKAVEAFGNPDARSADISLNDIPF